MLTAGTRDQAVEPTGNANGPIPRGTKSNAEVRENDRSTAATPTTATLTTTRTSSEVNPACRRPTHA
jgi:hypothetical protein